MKNKNPLPNFLTAVVLTVLALSAVQPVSAQNGQLLTISGWFNVTWGDTRNGTPLPPVYTLTDDNGQNNTLVMNEALAAPLGGVLSLNHQRVTIQGAQNLSALAGDGTAAIQVESIVFENPDVSALTDVNALAVTGAHPFVSIMCKFSDTITEPKNLSYFQGMYGSSHPGLDYYWREVSYNNINVVGSNAYGWYTLPHPHSYYMNGSSFNLYQVSADCTHAADADVNFNQFTGINLMFNSGLDGYAWGGSQYMTLDGVTQSWPITWEPPWGYENNSVIAHEMGHAFGLPHSAYSPLVVYDNVWDIMSDAWTTCYSFGNSDPTYGCLGQHTISYHKDILGWIPAEQKMTVELNSAATITLERLALPLTNNYLMAKIPINGAADHFYTVEARKRAGYDGHIPGEAVIIHEVLTTRSEPAHVIDSDGNGNTADEGAMWKVGETFTDSENNIKVSVLSTTASGFQVEILNGLPLPEAFSKSAPINNAINLATSTTISWEESNDVLSYEYCYDTTNDNACSNWVNTGLNTSASLTGLNIATSYYWQVRTTNKYGSTYANGNTYWKFNTGQAPAAFTKSNPINNAINLPLSLSLNWNVSSGITPTVSYEYCYDTASTCSHWINTGLNTSASITGLSIATTYYWQVRAINTFGITYADTNTYGAFRTGETPAVFTKSNPLNGAGNQPLSLSLKWNASSGTTPAVSYEYCYTTSGTTCDTRWVNMGLYRSVELRNLPPNTTYFWQVRAVNNFGTTSSNNGTWYSFTTDKLEPTSTFKSTAGNDGWTLESSEFSNKSSTKSNLGTLRVGDDAKNKQYRSLLYFDTASLPNNAVITKATLQIKMAGSVTGDTSLLGDLVADIKKGVFGLASLELTDFNAAGAPLNTAGSFSGSYQLTLSPVNFKYINLNGVTQFRLRFTKDDNNNKSADFISFYAGEDGANPPQLSVDYTVP